MVRLLIRSPEEILLPRSLALESWSRSQPDFVSGLQHAFCQREFFVANQMVHLMIWGTCTLARWKSLRLQWSQEILCKPQPGRCFLGSGTGKVLSELEVIRICSLGERFPDAGKPYPYWQEGIESYWSQNSPSTSRILTKNPHESEILIPAAMF